ncbi:MAG: signal peptidase II [Pelagibacteraceae bacterium]
MLNLFKFFAQIKNLLSTFLIVAIFVIDRFSKNIIIEKVSNNENKTFINDFLNFDLVWNSGIGFGLLDLEASIFYHILSGTILIVILVILILMGKTKKNDKFFYALIIGGAIGNLYDRIIYYSVPDFIDFHINDYHWFTFNVADIFISFGIILLIGNEILFKNEKN